MRNVGLSPSPTGTIWAGMMVAAAMLVLLALAPTASLAAADNDGIGLRGTLDMPPARDAQIADKLRAIVTAPSFDNHGGRDDGRQAMKSFYAAAKFAPLWLQNGRLSAKAEATIARLKDAAAEGLDPSDYPMPEFDKLAGAEALANADIALTQSVLTFARHLAVGRIAPTRVLAEVDYGDQRPAPAAILAKIANAADIDAAFDSFDPPAARFKALKAALADLRSSAPRAEADDRISEGPAIKLGDPDTRIPLLRARLNVPFKAGRPSKAYNKTAELRYDKALYGAIKQVQARADLAPTGVIDNRTLQAINGPSRAQKIDTVIANMERWRWLPHDLGDVYVMVNIPDYSLRVMHDGREVWTTKIVAGKPQTPTPLLSAAMDTVIVNPSWHVPQSIIQNELLPRYASDPQIFDRLGLEVKRGAGGHITVVQPPGAANALGRIKFNFPNKFQVYLHDTPEKRLFANAKRAFSHGCMRVEDPTQFGEIMLHLAIAGDTPTSRELYGMFGRDEHTFKLTTRPFVHLTYQTAFVDDAGTLQWRDDIYGIDARIHAILTSAERRIADIAPPPDPKREQASLTGRREILSRVERGEAANPMVFFEDVLR